MDEPNELREIIRESIDSLIKWRALSLELTGNPNQITRTRIGKKYEVLVNVLRDKITEWKLINSPINFNMENRFNDIIKIGELGTLWFYTNGVLTSNGQIFRLLSYDILNDVYRLEFGITGHDKHYEEVPGSQYPIHEYQEGNNIIKTMCNPLKL